MIKTLRSTLLLIVLLALVQVLSCSHQYRLIEERLTCPSLWPFYRGDLASRGAVCEGTFNGKLDVVWKRRVSDKPVGPLTLYYGTLVYPSAKNRIKFFDGLTGDYLGYLKSRGTAQTGVVVLDSLAFFATSPSKNWLRCVNLRTGMLVWKRRVKNATAGSIIVKNRIIIGSTEGALAAYRIEDGHLVWTFETEGACSSPPAYEDGKIFQPSDKGILYAVSPADGSEQYRITVEGPIVSAVAVSKMVFVTDLLGYVYGVDPGNGTMVWKRKLDGPIWTTPAVYDGHLFVGHSGGQLVALNEESGEILWQFDAGEVIKASATVVDDYVLIGTMGGKLFSLNVADGKLVSQWQLDGAVAYSPVTDGERIYVATEAGAIVCLGEADEHLTATADQ